MITDSQALAIVIAAWPLSGHARHQALAWAALVTGANARHKFSDWSAEDADAVFFAGGNPDLVEALGHQTPESYLDADA